MGLVLLVELIKIKKTDLLVNPSRKKTRSKANLGKPLEYLMNRSVVRCDIEGLIMHNFHDKPKKHVMENRKLLCDKWFLTYHGVFVALELKITRNGTNLPFANIEQHQIENLKRIEESETRHKGWFIIWFKDGRKSFGVYAIDGVMMHNFVNEYAYLKEYYKLETSMESRKSLSYKDVITIAPLTTRIMFLPIKKVLNVYNGKEETILLLEPLWGEK